MGVAAVPETLGSQIHAILGTALSDHAIAPGTVLLEAVIAEAFATSRTPVRKALERLCGEGRLFKLDGRGYLALDKNGRAPESRIKIDRESLAVIASGDLSERAPAWSRVIEEIEAEVAAAAVHGSPRVIEAEIGKRYGVSRTVVREALSRLHRSGLIDKDEDFHWRVTPLTAARARELYELRRALEPVALRRAAENGAFEAAAGMRDRLAALRARLPEVTAAELQPFERELHVDTLARCRNGAIMKALWIAQIQVSANRKLFSLLTEWFPMIVAEHLAIADRLANRDLRGAEEALIFHLDERKAELISAALARAAESGEKLPAYLRREAEPPLAS